MRRQDDGHASRQSEAGLPFRVLAPSESPFLSASSASAPAPPPPRAPDPYKVAPASTSYARAHRRSSFVIIAEARPATPESRSPSPTLNAGRVSPFRGRGFKGPPPRSKSRPQSPENVDGRRRRYDRRASLSQQSSPRRSLIPQPTRRRSTSLSKTTDSSSSPKIGRRVDSRNRLNVADSRRFNLNDSRNRLNVNDSRNRLNVNDSRNRLNAADSRSRLNVADNKGRFYNTDTRSRLNTSSSNISNGNGYGNGTIATNRRQTSRLPTRLSPIQGTPTKPDRSSSQPIRRDRSRDPTNRTSPTKIPRQTSPPKSVSNPKRFIQEKPSTRDRVTSPSKIPLKTGKFGSNTSLNAGRFVSAKPTANDRAGRGKESRSQRIDNGQNGEVNGHTNGNMNGSSRYDGSNGLESHGNSSSGERKDEIGLMELLKKSSGATGTSSVVSTTTSTAVQPLHIDANAVLIERDGRTNVGNSVQSRETSLGRSSNSTASKDDSPVVVYTQTGQQQRSGGQSNDDSRSSTAQQQRARAGNRARSNQVDVKGESPAGTDSVGGHSKASSVGQSVKSLNRTINGLSNGTGSATQRSNKIQSSVHATNEQNARNNRVNQKAEDSNRTSAGIASQADNARQNGMSAEAVKNTINKVAEGSEKISSAVGVNEGHVSSAAVSSNENENGATKAQIANSTSVGSNSVGVVQGNKANSVAGNSVGGAVNVGSSVNSEVRRQNENRGSNASLKSSTGMSTGSIESVRSTDTGVSVDTVRGVSSPREKTGVHVVKRPQEIETLSGNVMHLEQNGEPALLAGGAGVEEDRAPKTLLTRWGRALDRYCKCCPSMRCLACRRDPKGLLWARSQTNASMTTTAMQQNESAQPVAPAAMPAETVPAGCWDKFKSRCRCTRLREAKWCARRARIAPAEGTTCCPPERRFGAMCRRLFSCSKCKRSDVQHTRSIRAKHSLTSVAPPPLSEEPKAKIPDVLVEHNSLMRGAIPCLPVPLAWFCFIWNLLLPGTGTVWSGLFNLCVGQPRFSPVATFKSRFGAFIVNLIVGVGQLFTVLFCLVGWGWSIWWGVTMIRLARKYKRFKASEAANGDPEARAGEPAALPPGVPSQALRGMERAR